MARRNLVDAVSAAETLAAIARLGVVPVATIDDAGTAATVGGALATGGLACIEITLRTDAGLAAIAAARSGHPDLLIGAGTVLTVEQATGAVDAGATFVASPAYDDDVVGWCLDHDVLVLPGVMTPTEMLRARRAGLDVVKFFPAVPAGGAAAIAAAAAVFPDLRFVPTGGIAATGAADYLRLPAVAAVGGSWMVPREAVRRGDGDEIERLAREAVRLAETARGSDA